MFKKKILIFMMVGLLSLTGCSTSRKQKEEKKDEYKKYVTKEKDLDNDAFYVLKGKKYYPVYYGQASFEEDLSKATSASDDRSLFFNDDWENVPTLYAGDELIYHTTDDIDENFIFERYEDFGYSIGICNLERLSSGRYCFEALEEEKDENHNINPNSDANRLYEVNKEQVIIDNIGGAKLRSGNISRGGTIIGLNQNKIYAADVYSGSEMKSYSLKADTRILTSMEAYSVNNYVLKRSTILKINIPEYFNSGYYMINGKGIFRYVKGTEYSAKTDFNIPNEIPDENAEEVLEEEQEEIADSNNIVKETFTINEETDAEILFTYGESDSKYQLEEPVVKVIGTDSVYTLSEDDENTEKANMHLKAGQYTLEITGLSGRTYEYEIKKR